MGFNLPTLPVNIKSKPTEWVRPSDWPVITDNANTVQFLINDIGASQSCFTFGISTTYTKEFPNYYDLYIDWGDGSAVQTVSNPASTVTLHTYIPGTGTPCSRGYTTFVIKIWCGTLGSISTSKIQVARCGIYTTTSGAAANQLVLNTTHPLLEAYYGDNIQDCLPFYASGSTQRMAFCEYIKMPATLHSSITSLQSYYNNYWALQKIVLPTSMPSVANMSGTFQNCYKLRGDIVIPTDAPITNFSFAFSGCYNITSFRWLGGSLVTTMASAFNICQNLLWVELGSLVKCTGWNSTFQNCFNLQSFKLESWYVGVTSQISFSVNLGNMFQNCQSLEYVSWPLRIGVENASTGSVGGQVDGSGLFQGCSSLRTITLPHFYNSYVPGNLNTAVWSSCQSMFSGCSTLVSVYQSQGFTTNDPTWRTPTMTNTQSMFQNCFNLKTFQLSLVIGGAANNMFNACYSITEINLPGTWTPTDLGNAFLNCGQLKNITFNNAMNTLTSMSNAFSSCFSLKSVDFPSMTACSSIQQAFSGCFTIERITFPASMTQLSSMNQAFASCLNLKSITLPTQTFSGCNMTSAFFNNYSLEVVTLPANMGISTTTWGTSFSGCTGLEVITLPTTQITGIVAATSMFLSCKNLRTINNIDKLGNISTTGGGITISSWDIINIKSLVFPQRFALLQIQGTTTERSQLESLRLTNTGTLQWTGASPQINISFTNIGYANLVTLFNDIAAQGNITGKTINITSCTGASSLTASDRLILTSKGWTITG